MERKNHLLYNKKGSLRDLLLIGVFLIVAAASILLGYKISNTFNNQIQNDVIVNFPTEAKVAANQLNSYYPSVIDKTFLFLTVVFCLATLVLAALVRVHPVFLPLFIVGMIIIIFITGMISNIYGEMAANTELAAEAAQLTWISIIMNKLPLIVGIIGGLLAMVMHKLWRVDNA